VNAKRYGPSPAVTQGRHVATRPSAGLDVFRVRLRIRALLKALGPLPTEEIIRHEPDFPESTVRQTLRQLEEQGEAQRPIQTQLWVLVR
jgi:hypothetical protein